MTETNNCRWRARLLHLLDKEGKEAFEQDNDPTEWGKERDWRCQHGKKASYWLIGELAVIHEPTENG